MIDGREYPRPELEQPEQLLHWLRTQPLAFLETRPHKSLLERHHIDRIDRRGAVLLQQLPQLRVAVDDQGDFPPALLCFVQVESEDAQRGGVLALQAL
jgi:hypothetical protein